MRMMVVVADDDDDGVNHLLVSLNVEQLAIVRGQEFLSLLSGDRWVAEESEEEGEEGESGHADFMMVMIMRKLMMTTLMLTIMMITMPMLMTRNLYPV